MPPPRTPRVPSSGWPRRPRPTPRGSSQRFWTPAPAIDQEAVNSAHCSGILPYWPKSTDNSTHGPRTSWRRPSTCLMLSCGPERPKAQIGTVCRRPRQVSDHRILSRVLETPHHARARLPLHDSRTSSPGQHRVAPLMVLESPR